jgi:hypothetical protein
MVWPIHFLFATEIKSPVAEPRQAVPRRVKLAKSRQISEIHPCANRLSYMLVLVSVLLCLLQFWLVILSALLS